MMISEIENLVAFKRFKVDLTPLIPPTDNNILIVLHAFIIANDHKISSLEDIMEFSTSTLTRLLRTGEIKNENIRKLLLKGLSFKQDTDPAVVQELAYNIQCYFVCSYYHLREEQNEYFKKIEGKFGYFNNSAIEQLIYIISLWHYGVYNKGIVKAVEFVQKVREFFPGWIQKIIDVILISKCAVDGKKELVYKGIAVYEEKEDKDTWDSYFRNKFAAIFSLLKDRSSEICFLGERNIIEEITSTFRVTSNYLKMAKTLLLTGNDAGAEVLLSHESLEDNEYVDDRVRNLRLQYLSYIYFRRERYLDIIKCLSMMEEVGVGFYTSYYFLLYSYHKMFMQKKYDELFSHLKEISKPFENLTLVNELFELLMGNASRVVIREKYKKIASIIKIENRFGFIVILYMLKEKGIIKEY